MFKQGCWVVAAIVLAIYASQLPLGAAPVFAPAAVSQEPTVALSKAQAGSFTDALDALAAQGHRAIVAEGAPLVPHLAKNDVPDLTAGVPLSQAVAKIAAAYDYDVQKSEGVFVLTKRYTDPKDLPGVTLEECKLAFGDALTLLDRFNPQFDEAKDDQSERGAVRAFFGTLSPSQIQEAQAKTLHYRDLTTEQQEIVWRISLFAFVQFPADEIEEAEHIIDYAPKSVLTGKDGDYTGLLIQNTQPTDKTIFYYRPLYSPGRLTASSVPLLPVLLPTPKATDPPPAPEPKTLGEVVGMLPHTGPPPVVDAALQDKPVSVAGLSYTSSNSVLTALTVLYDLRISVSDAGGPLLTRQILTTDDSLQDLAENVWDTVPISLRRATHQEEALPSQGAPKNPPGVYLSFQRRMERQDMVNALRAEAEHQVLVSVQPQFHSQGLAAKIPVKTLSKAARCALAVALSGKAVQALLDNFTGQTKQNAMDCWKDTDDIVVYTVPSETATIHGQLVPSLYFTGTNPYTRQQFSLGGVAFGSSP